MVNTDEGKKIEIIHPTVEMKKANEIIEVYRGEFHLIVNDYDIKVDGTINFCWLPHLICRFEGLISQKEVDRIWDLPRDYNKTPLLINGIKFGDAFVSRTVHNETKNDSPIKGYVTNPSIIGDKNIAVEKIRFSVANLREIKGEFITSEINGVPHGGCCRLILETDEFIIALDKFFDYEAREDILDQEGGYLTLYGGELVKKKGLLTNKEKDDVIYCLDVFLSFYNGRRTSAMFIEGWYREERKWFDYTNYMVDTYKYVRSWANEHSIEGINELWKKFYELWKDDNSKHFLTTVIHWYVETNAYSGLFEGSLVMSQIALELIYNWWVVERKKLLSGNDKDNLSASNKIRLLISQVGITNDCPKEYKKLQSYIDDALNSTKDCPETIVSLRNAIVHSQETKRKRIQNIDDGVLYEALQVSIWYIELSLLCIMNYSGKYYNRVVKRKNDYDSIEYPPWVVTNPRGGS